MDWRAPTPAQDYPLDMDNRTLVLAGGLAFGGLASFIAGDGIPSTPPGEFFTWEELTGTSHGVNRLTPQAVRNLRALTVNTLDPFRRWSKIAMHPTSGYRSKRVNRKVGGADDSQHMRGEATDFVVDGATSEELAAMFLRSGVPFDQIVWYAAKPHLHVSYTTHRPLRRVVTWQAPNGKYTMGKLPMGAPRPLPPMA